MSWARIDDEAWSHEKFERLQEGGLEGLAAIGLWAMAISFAGKKMSPKISLAHATMLCGGDRELASLLLVRLRSTGLLEEDSASGVLRIHDWQHYRSKNEKKVEAGRKGGRKSGEIRKQKRSKHEPPDPGPDPDPDPDPDRCSFGANGKIKIIDDLLAMTHEWPGWSRPMGLSPKAQKLSRFLDGEVDPKEVDAARTEAENADGVPNIGLLLSIIARYRRNGTPVGERPERREVTPEEATRIYLERLEAEEPNADDEA